MKKLKKSRLELGNAWLNMRGVDYGMTVGLNLYATGMMWFEVVITP